MTTTTERLAEHRHLTTERAYVAATRRVDETQAAIAHLEALLEKQQNEVCQQLSDMSDEHMEWRSTRR